MTTVLFVTFVVGGLSAGYLLGWIFWKAKKNRSAEMNGMEEADDELIEEALASPRED